MVQIELKRSFSIKIHDGPIPSCSFLPLPRCSFTSDILGFSLVRSQIFFGPPPLLSLYFRRGDNVKIQLSGQKYITGETSSVVLFIFHIRDRSPSSPSSLLFCVLKNLKSRYTAFTVYLLCLLVNVEFIQVQKQR